MLSVEDDYDYGAAPYSDEVAFEMLQYEENIKELRRNHKFQKASELACSVDLMLKDVLDDCPLCGLVSKTVWELSDSP